MNKLAIGRRLGMAAPFLAAVGVACQGPSKPLDTRDAPPPPPPRDPFIDGLSSLEVLVLDPSPEMSWNSTRGALVPAHARVLALGTVNGQETDVTARVDWSVDGKTSPMLSGEFRTSIPGKYKITARARSTSESFVSDNFITVRLQAQFALAGARLSDTEVAEVADAKIVYPLDGALFPHRFELPQFQVTGAGSGGARVIFRNPVLDLQIAARCDAVDFKLLLGCQIKLTQAVEDVLVGASEVGPVEARVRVGASETPPIWVQYAPTSLSGAMYFWAAAPDDPVSETANTFIMRRNLSQPEEKLVSFYGEADVDKVLGSNPKGEKRCFGCHAISQDGQKMALTFGGSAARDWRGYAIISIKDKKILVNHSATGGSFAPNMTTFSPDAQWIVNVLSSGVLEVRGVLDALTSTSSAVVRVDLGPGERMSQPAWSQSGKWLSFISWRPRDNDFVTEDTKLDARYVVDRNNGDVVYGAQIWRTESDGAKWFGPPKIVVPRETGHTFVYPAISNDDQWIAFTESTCDGPPTARQYYGMSPCDGYDDPSAKIRLVHADGAQRLALDKLNGAGTTTNSWPRFGPGPSSADPTIAHTFRGKKLYWIAFSSRREYGLVVKGSNDGTSTPQIWFAGVSPDGPLDFAPVWMPKQNQDDGRPTGNHSPQWVNAYVPSVLR